MICRFDLPNNSNISFIVRLEQKRRTSRVTTDNEGSGESDDEDVMDLGMTVATANGNATTAAAAPNLYHSHYHDLMIRFEQQQKLSFFKQAGQSKLFKELY